MQKSRRIMGEAYLSLCRETDTPVSLGCWLRYKYSHKELADTPMHFGDYLESDTVRFAGDYACVSYLSKWKGLDIDVDLESVALQKFTTSEVSCLEANRRLRASTVSAIRPELSARFYSAKRKIAKLLGPFSLHKLEPFFEWGPGATFDIPRRRAQVDLKMVTVPITVSPTAVEILDSIVRLDLHWSASVLGMVPSGPFCFIKGTYGPTDACRVTTVPKSAKTDRTIAIEPTGNLFVQKGVGGYFRSRLKSVRVNLDDQEVNQRWAENALKLDLATLDLRAASDSVCRELVYQLLPYDWASFMDAVRSRSALMPDGTRVVLEKFSSMGNGFTFELESLIFWALTSAVTDEIHPGGILSVYGDDIICQKSVAQELILTLGFAGFETNDDKSFVSGLFYESCGKHYFDGNLVTPPYQKETFEPSDDPSEFFRAFNRLFRFLDRHKPGVMNPVNVFQRECEEWMKVCRLPYGVEGDDGFLSSPGDFMGHRSTVDPNRGFLCRVVVTKTRRLPGVESALLAHALRQRSSSIPWSYRDLPQGVVDPSYGDVTLPHRLRKQSISRTSLMGWRWVTPTWYCPLPKR